MIMEFTAEQQAKYLKHPFHCPSCGNENTDADPPVSNFEPENPQLTVDVSCLDCPAKWTEVYSLAKIKPRE